MARDFPGESFFAIQYGTKHHEIVSSSNAISIEPDLCLLREGGSSGEVVFVDQLNKSLRRRGFLFFIHNILILLKTCYLKVTSAARLIMALVTTPVCPSAAPRASPGKMYLVVENLVWLVVKKLWGDIEMVVVV